MIYNVLHWLFGINMLIAPSALRIADASSTAHLDKVERGYENMDHYNIEFKKEGKALRSIDFIQGEGTELMMAAGLHSRLRTEVILAFISLLIPSKDDEDEDEEDEDAGAEEEEGAQTVSGGSAGTAVSVQPSDPQQLNSSPSAAKSAVSS